LEPQVGNLEEAVEDLEVSLPKQKELFVLKNKDKVIECFSKDGEKNKINIQYRYEHKG
jgi:hypothetical protein